MLTFKRQVQAMTSQLRAKGIPFACLDVPDVSLDVPDARIRHVEGKHFQFNCLLCLF